MAWDASKSTFLVNFKKITEMIRLFKKTVSAFGLRQFYAAEFKFHLDALAALIVTSVFQLVVISTFDLSFDL